MKLVSFRIADFDVASPGEVHFELDPSDYARLGIPFREDCKGFVNLYYEGLDDVRLQRETAISREHERKRQCLELFCADSPDHLE